MDIEFLTEMISQEKSILVLGPDIAFDSKKSLLKELSNFLNTKRFKHSFHDEEELFSSATKFKPMGFRHFAKFFENMQAAQVYKKIAEIPFHLIISLSPDLLLKQTFEANNFDFSFDYYHKGKATNQITKPSKHKPLLFNILGQFIETTSLVLCFNDLFDYLASILGANELDSDFRTELEEAQNVFFLGFKYDKWYLKLIMRLLNKDDDVMRQAAFKEVEEMENIINFYTDEFNFVFEDDLSGNEIIDELHKYFAEKEQLRQPKKETEKPVQNITNITNITGNDNIVAQNLKGNINIDKK